MVRRYPECLKDLDYGCIVLSPILEDELLKGQPRPLRSDMAGILVGRVDHPRMIIYIVIDHYHNHHYLHIN